MSIHQRRYSFNERGSLEDLKSKCAHPATAQQFGNRASEWLSALSWATQQIDNLKDKLRRRNALVTDLRGQVKQCLNALKVICKDPDISNWLKVNDPKAYSQIVEAINK